MWSARETGKKKKKYRKYSRLHTCYIFSPVVDSAMLCVLHDNQAATEPQFESDVLFTKVGWSNMRATFSTSFPFSLFLSFFDDCLQFPTFFSVTWATNQVPGSRAAARLEVFEPTPQWINVNVCRNTPESCVSYWYSGAAARCVDTDF